MLSLLLGLPLVVLATWYGTHFALYWEHVARFAGVCGPHAPDIAAHPCTYDVYVAEFDAGFAGVGLLFFKVVAVVIVVPAYVAAWASGFPWWHRRVTKASAARADTTSTDPSR